MDAAGLIGFDKTVVLYKGDLRSGNNYNNFTTAGVYQILDDSANASNRPSLGYGILIVFTTNVGYILQIAANITDGSIYKRSRNESGSWSTWKKFTLS